MESELKSHPTASLSLPCGRFRGWHYEKTTFFNPGFGKITEVALKTLKWLWLGKKHCWSCWPDGKSPIKIGKSLREPIFLSTVFSFIGGRLLLSNLAPPKTVGASLGGRSYQGIPRKQWTNKNQATGCARGLSTSLSNILYWMGAPWCNGVAN